MNKNNNGISRDNYANYLSYNNKPMGIGLNQIAEIRKQRNLPKGPVYMAGVGGFK